ncbi:MAG: hypothetical protein ACOY0T_22795 [Myxococcota bacterium]
MTRKPTHCDPSALARWLAHVLGTFALALLTAGHVLPVLHFTLVAHELCEEHGALHHVEAKSRGERSAREQGLRAAAHTGHEHEHCGVVATGSERALAPVLTAACNITRVVVDQGPSVQARSAHASLLPLDYAPKLAPPVA